MCIDPQWISPVRTYDDDFVSYAFTGFKKGNPVFNSDTGELFEPFEVGCGKCLECINLHKLQWTHRLLDEASCHCQSMFLTLTYSSDDPEFDDNLHSEHVMLFIRDLRNSLRKSGIKIRYYLCGEYGSKGSRPHYHVIIFGYEFQDLWRFQRDRKGFFMCRSPTLELLWRRGFSSVLPVCEHTLAYVTKDMQKFNTLPDGRLAPFVRMSTHPGIGADGWNRSLSDGKLWHNSHSVPLPRYYVKLAQREGLDLSHLMRLYANMPEREPIDYDRRKKYKKNVDRLLT